MNRSSLGKFSIIIVVALFAAVPAFAATTGTLTLSGVVAPVTSVTVTPDANASSLPVGTTVSGLKIATVNELSNDKAGYSLTLSTANGAQLKEAAGTDALSYSLSYNGVAVAFSSGSATISDTAARTSGSGVSKDLAISFAAAFLNADSYSDTLTFTITAK